MSVRCEQPVYKLFEPGYRSQRPIIVDEALESPETVTLRYEEEAAVRANGGDLRGDSPPGLLPMSGYKSEPPQLHSFTDSQYQPYPQQAFQGQPAENVPSQMTQMAYAAGSTPTSATQYMGSISSVGSSAGVSVLECHPSSGAFGTKVLLKVSSQYDMTAPAQYTWMLFGNQKCPAQIFKNDDGCTYAVSADAPQFMVTGCTSLSNVPLGLLVESEGGDELARVDNFGSFTYHDGSQNASAGVGINVGVGRGPASDDASAHDGLVTRKSPRSPEQHQSPPHLTVRTSANTSPTTTAQGHQLRDDSATNTYGYPSGELGPASAVDAAQMQQQQQVQSNFAADAAAYNSAAVPIGDQTNMLSAYRTSSFTGQYPRHPPSLRSSASAGGGWHSYAGLSHGGHDRYESLRSSASGISHAHSHTSITRPSLTPSLPAPSPGAPQLIRTSTISGSPGTSMGGGVGYNNPWAVYPTKAVLNIAGNLDSMASDWSQEEWNNQRRIVVFRKKQNGSHLEMSFKPVSVTERPPNSICISCIWWAEKQECYVTSVDTIHLLEQLVAAPARFTVEEKNRIRRNLEGYKPQTVSKAKADSEDFFKLIMGFSAPKPRNIEKDVKVFPWKVLGQALKKIISKYSASPSSTTMPPAMPPTPHLLTPVSISPSYQGLPPTPGSTTTATDPTNASAYIHPADAVPSPRSLTGGPLPSSTSSAWGPAAYPAPLRMLSPGLKTNAELLGGAGVSRMTSSTLPSVYDMRVGSQYGLPPQNHHHQHHHQHHSTHSSNHHQHQSTTPSYHTQHHSQQPSPVTHGGSNRWDPYDATGAYTASTTHHPHTTQSQIYGTSAYSDGVPRA